MRRGHTSTGDHGRSPSSPSASRPAGPSPTASASRRGCSESRCTGCSPAPSSSASDPGSVCGSSRPSSSHCVE
ncbi:addiction module antitoxin [Ralstonia solanacearum]|nr:addiction module antitoxin [Ralstonia solanacearum]